MELSKLEVANWHRDPVTKKILARMKAVEADATEMMVQGVDNYHYGRGFIAGLRMIHNIEGDDQGEEE